VQFMTCIKPLHVSTQKCHPHGSFWNSKHKTSRLIHKLIAPAVSIKILGYYYYRIHNVNKYKSTLQWHYTTLHYTTLHYTTPQYNTIQYNTIQYNTIQYNTIQYNTIQYAILHYITLHDTLQRLWPDAICVDHTHGFKYWYIHV